MTARERKSKERAVTKAFEKALKLWKQYKLAQDEANKLYRDWSASMKL